MYNFSKYSLSRIECICNILSSIIWHWIKQSKNFVEYVIFNGKLFPIDRVLSSKYKEICYLAYELQFLSYNVLKTRAKITNILWKKSH